MDLIKIYNRLPVFAQNIACYHEGKKIASTRLNNDFHNLLSEYLERSKWSEEEIESYSNQGLLHLIRHAYESVPYYNKIFKELGVEPEDIKSKDDLRLLPIINKKTIIENFDDFISNKVTPGQRLISRTSGTTGTGFKFYTTLNAINEQWAVWWRYRINNGIKYGTNCAVFGGKTIVPAEQKKPPFFRFNTPCNQIYFSVYHISETNLKYYINALNKYKVPWIHGYTSAIVLLSNLMMKENVSLDYQIEHITTGSENLMEHQKKAIFDAFGVWPKQHYGAAEGAANISENFEGELKIDEDFCVIEFLENINDQYRMIGTNLTNYAMPFIRYDTGDLVTLEKECGNVPSLRIKDIDGRKEDYVLLPDGTKIGRMNLIFLYLTNIVEAQIIQSNLREINIYLVVNSNYSDIDEKALLDACKLKLGEKIRINLIYVEKIPRTANGKLRFVINEMENGKL